MPVSPTRCTSGFAVADGWKVLDFHFQQLMEGNYHDRPRESAVSSCKIPRFHLVSTNLDMVG